jgi:hypothetical protein
MAGMQTGDVAGHFSDKRVGGREVGGVRG